MATKHRKKLLKLAILEIVTFLPAFCEKYIVFCFWKSNLWQFFGHFDNISLGKTTNPFQFYDFSKLCDEELAKEKFQTHTIRDENGKDYKNQLIMHF